MEENNNNNVNKEEIKNDTKEAVNDVKDAFKGFNFKNELENLKEFTINLFKTPLKTIKSVANGEKNEIVVAVILLVLEILIKIISDAIYYGMNEYLEISAKVIVLDIISPIIFAAVFTIVVYFLGGKEKKKLSTILSSALVSYTPIILSKIIYIIFNLIEQVLSVGFVYSMIYSTLLFINYIFVAISLNELITKSGNEEKDFRKIILIVFIIYVVINIFAKLEIYSSF